MKHNVNLLCKQQPQRVQINASFVIDLRYVTFEVLGADDNGSYIKNGSPTHTFECVFKARFLTSHFTCAESYTNFSRLELISSADLI